MTSDERITTSRRTDAPVERVFAMLADPDRYPDFDRSRTVRAARTDRTLVTMPHDMTHDWSASPAVSKQQLDLRLELHANAR